MKAGFFSFVALAASAFAAPVAQDSITDILTDIPGESLLSGLDLPAKRYDDFSVKISSNDDLFKSLNGVNASLGSVSSSLRFIVNRYTAGKIPQAEAAGQAIPELKKLETLLTGVTSQLGSATGVNITATADIKAVADLCIDLFSTVLDNLKIVVCAFGTGHPDIQTIVKSICNILGKVLTILTGLVTAIIPSLVHSLQPIIQNLGQSLLSPIINTLTTSVNGLLSGIGL